MLRWANEETFSELNEYYCGLIRLRKRLKGLYDKSADKVFEEKIIAPKFVSFKIKNDAQSELFVLYNAADEDQKVSLPEGNWKILVNKEASDISLTANKEVLIKSCSGMLLIKED